MYAAVPALLSSLPAVLYPLNTVTHLAHSCVSGLERADKQSDWGEWTASPYKLEGLNNLVSASQILQLGCSLRGSLRFEHPTCPPSLTNRPSSSEKQLMRIRITQDQQLPVNRDCSSQRVWCVYFGNYRSQCPIISTALVPWTSRL